MKTPVALVALAFAQPCYAQEDSPAQTGAPPAASLEQGWTLSLGIAPVLSPAWLGARDTTLSVFPDLRINYEDTLFASIPEGIGWNAINADGWKAGPVAKVNFGRNEDEGGSPFRISGGSSALRGLGDIGASVEVGGFVEKRFGSDSAWRVRGEIRRGFGGHEGVLADASLTYSLRAGRILVSVGPRASFGSQGFMQTYFGIDASQAARSGLARYEAGGGLISYGLGAVLVRPVGRRGAATLFAGLDRLGTPASHSPLVEQRGRRTQFTLGLGYGWRFSL